MTVGLSLSARPSHDADPVGNLQSGGLQWRALSTTLALVVSLVSAITTLRDDIPPVSGVLVLVLCAALLMKIWLRPLTLGRRIASALALLVGGTSIALLVTYLFGLPAQAVPLPSPYTAACTFLLAWATYALDCRPERAAIVGAAAALSSTLVPALALLRQAPTTSAGDPVYAASIPVGSAVITLLLAIAVIAARPARPPLGPLGGSGALPFTVLGLLAVVASWSLAWLLEGELRGSAAPRVTTTVIVILQLLVFAGVMVGSLILALRRERERARQLGALGAEAAFHSLTSESDVGFAVVDRDGLIRVANPSLCRFLGVGASSLVGTPWTELNASLSPSMAGAVSARLPFVRPDGRQVWADILVTPTQDPQTLVLQLIDRTDAQRLSEELQWRASHDSLTGCLSRQAILEQVHQGERAGSPGTVVAIDIDNFRFINEALGAEAADAVLRALADLLDEAAPPGTLIGRLYGDVFLLVTPPLSASNGTDVATRLVAHIGGADLTDERVRVTACAGVTTPRGEGDDSAVNEALAALAAAKEVGPGHVGDYGAGMRTEAAEMLELLQDLRSVTRSGNTDSAVVFWFQPLVALGTRTIVGFETLVRWHHPVRGLIPAGAFIASAEHDLDVISWIGESALRAAAEHCRRWHGRVEVSVNLSGRQIASESSLAGFVELALDLSRDPDVRLGIEITETVAAQLTPHAVFQLEQLAGAGCRLYLDDFGAGYSSIAHLRTLPVSTIKLDREYALAAMESPSARDLAEGMAALARSMGITSLVEGLEDEAMVERLAAAGFEVGQGWHLGRPGPAEQYLPQ
ncbi:MAG: EAL domain-containing protein [Actinomycetales bacterium]|nr:EAL domain-containing protein [Actinomycetales bacterium]